MFDNEQINACLMQAKVNIKNNDNNSKSYNMNHIIKIIQLEEFTIEDIKKYLSKLCNNQMTSQTLEVILAIIRLYSFDRLPQSSHINNPQALAVIKDLEEYLLNKVAGVLVDNKENIIINESKISLFKNYFKKKYCSFNFFNIFNIWKYHK